jgi:predicted nucleic acid-binding protein
MNILDSNIIIYSSQPEYAYLRELIFDKQNAISKITQLEVLGFHRLNDTEKDYFTACFQFLKTIDISNKMIDEAIILRQQRKMSVGDAIIAATALNYQATVFTRNVDDFLKIADLKVINPIRE